MHRPSLSPSQHPAFERENTQGGTLATPGPHYVFMNFLEEVALVGKLWTVCGMETALTTGWPELRWGSPQAADAMSIQKLFALRETYYMLLTLFRGERYRQTAGVPAKGLQTMSVQPQKNRPSEHHPRRKLKMTNKA